MVLSHLEQSASITDLINNMIHLRTGEVARKDGLFAYSSASQARGLVFPKSDVNKTGVGVLYVGAHTLQGDFETSLEGGLPYFSSTPVSCGAKTS